MNVLDENVPESQRLLLKKRRIPIRQIGLDAGRAGMDDEEIPGFLHTLDRPTFFTRDSDFDDADLRHARYCIAFLDVDADHVADFIVRTLRHPEFNTKARRMGKVLRVSVSGISASDAGGTRFFAWTDRD